MAGATRETAKPVELSQRGAIIGAFPEMNFGEGSRDLPAFSRLYIFSDGIYEVTRPDGTILTYEEFVGILADSKRSSGAALEHTIGAIRAARGGDQFEDDVSIIELAF
jgi:sigma-B regulation protein RsbU (phosphoserine phosphatase)